MLCGSKNRKKLRWVGHVERMEDHLNLCIKPNVGEDDVLVEPGINGATK